MPLPQARAIADRAIVDCDTQADVSDSEIDSATTSKLDQTSAEAGVREVVTESYGASSVSSVHCPALIPITGGTSVTCSLTIDGVDKTVTLTIIDSDGNYEVGLPK